MCRNSGGIQQCGKDFPTLCLLKEVGLAAPDGRELKHGSADPDNQDVTVCAEKRLKCPTVGDSRTLSQTLTGYGQCHVRKYSCKHVGTLSLLTASEEDFYSASYSPSGYLPGIIPYLSNFADGTVLQTANPYAELVR